MKKLMNAVLALSLVLSSASAFAQDAGDEVLPPIATGQAELRKDEGSVWFSLEGAAARALYKKMKAPKSNDGDGWVSKSDDYLTCWEDSGTAPYEYTCHIDVTSKVNY